jgi:hypothetical protein
MKIVSSQKRYCQEVIRYRHTKQWHLSKTALLIKNSGWQL